MVCPTSMFGHIVFYDGNDGLNAHRHQNKQPKQFASVVVQNSVIPLGLQLCFVILG